MNKPWPIKKLGKVADVYGGGTPPTSHSEYFSGNTNWFTPTELPVDNVGTVSESNRKISDQAQQFTTISGMGTVLLSSRATIGNVAILSNASGYNQGIKGIEPKEEIDNWYLGYWLKANKDKLLQKSFGTTFKEISTSAVKDLDIAIPPKVQQKKIVERLDAIRKAQELCDQQIQKTEELFKSLLNSEFSDKNKWSLKELEEVSHVTSSKRIFQKDYVKNGVPFYRTKEIAELSREQLISLNLYISKDQFHKIKNEFGIPKKGDILISAVGTIGISWIVPDDREFYFKDGNLLWIKSFKGIEAKYLKFFLNYSFNSVSRMAAGGAYKALTIINLKKLKIPVAPISRQKEIIEKLEAVQDYKNLLQRQKTLLKELFDSVLDKSMKGELDNL